MRSRYGVRYCPKTFAERAKIYATDLDEDALRQGRHAAYSEKSVSAIDPGLLDKYFVRNGQDYWAALCLTFYMVAAACGMVVGGFLAADASRCEKTVAVAFGVAAAIALLIGLAPLPAWLVPVAFSVMGLASGMAGPSRDLIVKRSAPPNSTGRVYGVVYSGLDIGQAFAPLVFAPLLDLHRPADVWLGIAIAQALMITTAVNVRRGPHR